MTKYERLMYEAECHGAKVIEIDLDTDKPCGKCVDNIIVINSNINTKEKTCILAEELGHYIKNLGDITNQTEICNKKQELVARRWGFDKAVGLVGLINAFENNCRTAFEIADFLGVTKEYFDEAIDYYRAKYGVMYKIDNYIIYFIPSLGICKMF
ncbi:ImmA/IrrE family metallo-endopeptidase [Clostridium perfringens]|nr:ImmA/IrrE family metallo-endopeptidase [Clostridium perfringens]MDM0951660.1 ImmA/IrrE family metallo-endopeptidase [Clostridium perfringens]